MSRSLQRIKAIRNNIRNGKSTPSIFNVNYSYFKHQHNYFSVIQSRPTPTLTPAPLTENIATNETSLSNQVLTMHELNEMVIDPEKYDAMKLKPYFRRIPREGLVMHSFVLSWYSFTAFAVVMYILTAAVSYYDVYVTKESIEPKDKSWAKEMNVLQRMYYDYWKKNQNEGETTVFK
eukprot:UN00885